MFPKSIVFAHAESSHFLAKRGLAILMVNAQQESKFHLRTARVRERNGSSIWGLGGIFGGHLGPAQNPKALRAPKLMTNSGVKKASFESEILIMAGRLPLKWRDHFLRKSGSTRHGQKRNFLETLPFSNPPRGGAWNGPEGESGLWNPSFVPNHLFYWQN